MYDQFFWQCCHLTSICANAINLTYGEFNVLMFLHIQPITYILSAYMLVLASRKNLFLLNFNVIFLLLYTILTVWLIMTYPVCDDSFLQIYDDLHVLAESYNVSYITINYILFIVLFLFIHIVNLSIICFLKFHKKTD